MVTIVSSEHWILILMRRMPGPQVMDAVVLSVAVTIVAFFVARWLWF
jgi:hypothetical protein